MWNFCRFVLICLTSLISRRCPVRNFPICLFSWSPELWWLIDNLSASSEMATFSTVHVTGSSNHGKVPDYPLWILAQRKREILRNNLSLTCSFKNNLNWPHVLSNKSWSCSLCFPPLLPSSSVSFVWACALRWFLPGCQKINYAARGRYHHRKAAPDSR